MRGRMNEAATPTTGAGGKAVWVIAHLSDPHLSVPAVARPLALPLKQLLSYASWRRKRSQRHQRVVLDAVVGDLLRHQPHHLLVTGDLTHLGLPGECDQALEWLEQLAVAVPVSVIPGNHDCLVAADWSATVGRWDRFQQHRSPAAADRFPTFERVGPVALIGLNSAAPSAPLLADGRVGATQRAHLAELLRATGAAGLFRLVFVHHSPLRSGHAWRKRLRDADELTDVLFGAGAEMVVHGHGHAETQRVVPTSAGRLLVVGAPSASLVGDRRAGWNGYAIERLGGHWRVTVTAHRCRAGRLVAEPATVQDLPRPALGVAGAARRGQPGAGRG
jgi:3',5'-cyclic AMP phosphodiesterase CpdA